MDPLQLVESADLVSPIEPARSNERRAFWTRFFDQRRRQEKSRTAPAGK